MEGMPFLKIAGKNSLTLYEFIECRDIIIEKLNQDIVSYPEKEDHP
jgi:hypothetical protein